MGSDENTALNSNTSDQTNSCGNGIEQDNSKEIFYDNLAELRIS